MEKGGPLSTQIAPDDGIELERLGGFGGFGLPGSAIRSRAVLRGTDLSAAHKRALEQLLDGHAAAAPPSPAGSADGFRYRVTHVCGSERRTVEVDEAAVPQGLRARVKDELI